MPGLRASRAGAGEAMACRVQVEDRPGTGISIIAAGILAGVSSEYVYLGRAAGVGAGDDNAEALQYTVASAECICIQ